MKKLENYLLHAVIAGKKELVAWDYDERLWKKLHFLSGDIFKKHGIPVQELKAPWPHISAALVDAPLTRDEREKLKMGAKVIKPKFEFKQFDILVGLNTPFDYFSVEFKTPPEFERFLHFAQGVCGTERVTEYKEHRPHLSLWMFKQEHSEAVKALFPEIQKDVRRYLQPFTPVKLSIWEDFEIAEIESIGFLRRVKMKYRIVPTGVEARKISSPTRLYYHGTCSKYLSSILKQGMLPTSKEGVWKKEDPESSFHTPSRQSFEGTYWSSNVITSLRYANDAKRKFGGNALVVFAQLQPKSTLPDEDDFISIIGRALDKVWGKEYSVGSSEHALASVFVSLATKDEHGKKIQDNFRGAIYEHLDDLVKETPQLNDALDALLLAEVKRKLSHVHDVEYLIKRNLPNTTFPASLKLKPKAEAEQDYRNALRPVMTMLRRLTTTADSYHKTLRIAEPVLFSGRNRIITILEILESEEGSSTKYVLKVRYGGAIPDIWLEGFKNVWSPNVVVER